MLAQAKSSNSCLEIKKRKIDRKGGRKEGREMKEVKERKERKKKKGRKEKRDKEKNAVVKTK